MKIKENYVMCEVADQAIVVPIGEESDRFKGIINLNHTGRDVWTYLESGMDLTEIAKKISEKYEVDENIAVRDIKKMSDKLYETGVLEK